MRAWLRASPFTNPSTAIGASCSTPLTGLRRLPRLTFGEWRIRYLCPPIVQLALLKLPRQPTEVRNDDDEENNGSLLCCRSRPSDYAERLCASTLEKNPGSATAGLSPAGTETHRVAHRHSDLPAGGSRAPDD